MRIGLEFSLAVSRADILSLGIEWVDCCARMAFPGLYFARSLDDARATKLLDYLSRRLFPDLPPMTPEESRAVLQTEILDIVLDEYRRLKKSGQLQHWKGPRTIIGQGGWQVR